MAQKEILLQVDILTASVLRGAREEHAGLRRIDLDHVHPLGSRWSCKVKMILSKTFKYKGVDGDALFSNGEIPMSEMLGVHFATHSLSFLLDLHSAQCGGQN